MRTLTEISYTGNKITLSRLQKYRRGKFFEQVQVVDDKKRVIDLKVSDLSGSQLKLWYHVTFKYDDKDRVVEQSTDPFKLGSGDDYSPIPGKLVVSYDDEKHRGGRDSTILKENYFFTLPSSSIVTAFSLSYAFLTPPVRNKLEEKILLIPSRIR